MEIRRSGDGQSIELRDIDLFFAELLRRIPPSADPAGSEAAQQRLYSTPTHGADAQMDEDWKEYVTPELRQLFESSIETVQADLGQLPPDSTDEDGHLIIPSTHLDAWIHVLNQARITLTARHNFTEADMDRMPTGGDSRALALLQVHMYGVLLEGLLQQLD